MSWLDIIKTAGTAALSTIQFIGRLLYTLSTPLRWPFYYIYAIIIFLLSPIWVIASLVFRAASYIIDLAASFKYLYIYLSCAIIIGGCAGFVLHSTSSYIVVLLGWDRASERRKRRDQRYLAHAQEDDESEFHDNSSSSARWRRSEPKESPSEFDPNDLFEKQWKVVRKPIQPGRRRKGLLGQTIHEESSEGDLS